MFQLWKKPQNNFFWSAKVKNVLFSDTFKYVLLSILPISSQTTALTTHHQKKTFDTINFQKEPVIKKKNRKKRQNHWLMFKKSKPLLLMLKNIRKKRQNGVRHYHN